MTTLTSQLESYKLRARRHRSNMLKALERGDEQGALSEFVLGKGAIDEGFQLLKSYGDPDPKSEEDAGEGESEVAKQLADMWGILGGLYRSRGESVQAIGAYDHGYEYESARRFHILSSYNTVNRLVLRILNDPAVLASTAPVQGFNKSMIVLLHDAAKLIEHQLDEGRDDTAWALADLAMLELLSSSDNAHATLAQLGDSTASDHYPIQSMLNVIRDLLRQDLPVEEKMIEAGIHLQSRLPEALRGEPLKAG